MPQIFPPPRDTQARPHLLGLRFFAWFPKGVEKRSRSRLAPLFCFRGCDNRQDTGLYWRRKVRPGPDYLRQVVTERAGNL